MSSKLKKLLVCLKLLISDYYFQQFQQFASRQDSKSQDSEFANPFFQDPSSSHFHLNSDNHEKIKFQAFSLYENFIKTVDKLDKKIKSKIKPIEFPNKQISSMSSPNSLNMLTPEENPFRIPMQEQDEFNILDSQAISEDDFFSGQKFRFEHQKKKQTSEKKSKRMRIAQKRSFKNKMNCRQ